MYSISQEFQILREGGGREKGQPPRGPAAEITATLPLLQDAADLVQGLPRVARPRPVLVDILGPGRRPRGGEGTQVVFQGQAVAVVVPNHMHLPVARAFLEHGIHVICDKPLTGTLADAQTLKAAAEASDALFILTHN